MSDIESIRNSTNMQVGPITDQDVSGSELSSQFATPPLTAGKSANPNDVLNNKANLDLNAPPALLKAMSFPQNPFIDTSPDHAILKFSNPELTQARDSTILPYIGMFGTKRFVQGK